MKLLAKIFSVAVYRLEAQEKLFGDLLDGLSLYDECQDLTFTKGQCWHSLHFFMGVGTSFLTNIILTIKHCLNGFQKFLGRDALEQVSVGSCLHRSGDDSSLRIHRENNDAH